MQSLVNSNKASGVQIWLVSEFSLLHPIMDVNSDTAPFVSVGIEMGPMEIVLLN